MSTIRVDNFGPSAGGTTYSARGIPTTWVNVNADSGTPVVRDSVNVSSITDNAVGRYYVNFTNNYGAVDYSTTGGITCDPSVYPLALQVHAQNLPSASYYATTAQFGIQSINTGGTLLDFAYWGTQTCGDLA